MNTRNILLIASSTVCVFCADFFLESVFLGRLAVFSLLFLSSLLLPKNLALVPSLFAVPFDLMLTARALNSLDLIIWAGFVSVPFARTFVSLEPILNLSTEQKENSQPSKASAEAVTDDLVRDVENNKTRFREQESELRDPSDVLQSLLTERFQSGQKHFGYDNMLYFHVTDSKAHLGYLINDCGKITVDKPIGSDVRQGVGWVLRHGDTLNQDSGQLDWRNLLYHRRAVNLNQVRMEPITNSGSDLIGVFVTEWSEKPDYDENRFEEFIDEISKLMKIDRDVRRIEKTQRHSKLLEKVSEIETSSGDRFETLTQRVVDLIRTHVTADHVKFVSKEELEENSTLLKQRTVFYQKCANWIEDNQQILRIDKLTNHAIAGQNLSRVAPNEIESFMGGAIYHDETLIGFIFLDHSDSSFFTQEDERVLTKILSLAKQKLTSGKRMKRLHDDQQTLFSWIQTLSNTDMGSDFNTVSKRLLQGIIDDLAVTGATLYWDDGHYRAITSVGSNNLPETISHDHVLARRLSDTGDGELSKVPLSSMQDESPKSVKHSEQSIWLLSIGGDDRSELSGFMSCLPAPEFEDIHEEILNKTAGHMAEILRTSAHAQKLSNDVKKDSVTDMPSFETWERDLSKFMSESPARSTIWSYKVPELQILVDELGYRDAKKWTQRVSRTLVENVDANSITRVFGSTFFGFSTATTEETMDQFSELITTVRGWTIPGSGKTFDPEISLKTYQPPYPDIDRMLDKIEAVERLNTQSANAG